MNATALPICFWCSLAPATHNMNHTLLGARPSCDACDPTTAPEGVKADVLDRMIGTLTHRRRQLHEGFAVAALRGLVEACTELLAARKGDHDRRAA